MTTGIGAVINTAKVEPGANVVIFGLGGIGLNVDPGLPDGRRRHDRRCRPQPQAEALARKFGLTHFVNPTEVEGDLVPYLVNLTKAAPTTVSSASATSGRCGRRSNTATGDGASA